jgi:hypothetical protein
LKRAADNSFLHFARWKSSILLVEAADSASVSGMQLGYSDAWFRIVLSAILAA